MAELTDEEICKLIIKNKGCFDIGSITCVTCPLHKIDHDHHSYSFALAKKWLKENKS